MPSLGMLYALTDDEVEKLRSIPEEERYGYMLEEIEEILIDTPRGCEINKAWEGLQYCLCGGKWNDDNKVPANIIYGGEYLVNIEDDQIITLKNHDDVEKIVAYLQENDIEEIINKNFWNIEDPEFTHKNEDELDNVLGWSEDILSFYENAKEEHCQVIFTVDF